MCCISVYHWINCRRYLVEYLEPEITQWKTHKELNIQPEISQSWWRCSGTSKPGLAGRHCWCEREEADFQLATTGDPAGVGKATVRTEECWPLCQYLGMSMISEWTLLLQIKVIFIPKVTLFPHCLEEMTNSWFSPVDKVCHNINLQNRFLNCRHWLPAGL